MGGGPSQTTQTTFSEPWGPARGPGRQYMRDMWSYLTGNGFGAGMMNDPFPNQYVAGFTNPQNAGFSDITGAATGLTGMSNGGLSMMDNTLAGNYLNPSTNPYLADTSNAAAQTMMNQYEDATSPGIAANFINGGGFGSSAMTNAQDAAKYGLGTNLAQLNASIYGQNYQNERSNMMQALGLMPTVDNAALAPGEAMLNIGNQQQQQNQNVLDTNYQNAYQQAQFPFQVAQMMQSAITGIGNMGSGSVSVAPFMGGGKGL